MVDFISNFVYLVYLNCFQIIENKQIPGELKKISPLFV